jgi:UPF0755 protein
VRPERTEDLYFVADGSGGHAFAKTLAEQSHNIALRHPAADPDSPAPAVAADPMAAMPPQKPAPQPAAAGHTAKPAPQAAAPKHCKPTPDHPCPK